MIRNFVIESDEDIETLETALEFLEDENIIIRERLRINKSVIEYGSKIIIDYETARKAKEE